MSQSQASTTSSATTTETITVEATEVSRIKMHFRDLSEGFYHLIFKLFLNLYSCAS